MTPQATIEREIKLGVWPGFEVPDLGKLNGSSHENSEQRRLEAVYFDTLDLRLLRRGVTLRFRRGEEPRELWTAKLPEDAPIGALVRREISVPGRPGTIPPLLNDLVRGWALGAALVPVARLRTLRNRTTLRRAGGEAVAVVDDDEVSIIRQSRVAARFRELELELAGDAPPQLLRRLARRMCSAGAQPVEQIPKLVRALGPAALTPWDLAARELPKRPSAAELITAAFVSSAARFVDHIALAVLDEDPEGTHQVRVGIRRLRSDLQTVRPLLDASKVRPLRGELDWLMREFGAVRDWDILLSRLRHDAQLLDPKDYEAAEAVIARASHDRAEAYERLMTALRTPRCAALLEETARFVKTPPFVGRDAKRPGARVLPQLVRGPLRKMRREARRRNGVPGEDELHRLRIEVKRVRYAAELAAPVAGKQGRRAARGLAQVQDVLGEHHDSCTAVGNLRALGARSGPEAAWGAGLLAGLQLAHAADDRRRFEPAWAAAMAAKRWHWVE